MHLVYKEVSLRLQAAVVDEYVGISCDARHGTRDVVIQPIHLLSPHAHRLRVQQLHVDGMHA